MNDFEDLVSITAVLFVVASLLYFCLIAFGLFR